MHRGELAFPFRRYQIQPVWRADRPQRGRYREFYQCDADIVGSDSLLNEIDLLAIYDTVFSRLGLRGCQLRVNNRKVLSGLAECVGQEGLLTEITMAIDKLEKTGLEAVKQELADRGITAGAMPLIERFLAIAGTNEEKLCRLEDLLGTSAHARQGIEELRSVICSRYVVFREPPVLDQTLARGLNYYTGTIMEAKAPSSVRIGSIGGGGRYDDLTGLFGMSGISGVGISFGVDRIYDVMEELDLFPSVVQQSTQVLFLQIDKESLPQIFSLLRQLREAGISAEVYPDQVKMDKQMKYADKRGIPFIAIIGEGERNDKAVSIKNMMTGKQEKLALSEWMTYFDRAAGVGQ
jgi:histidyl-tRNA synthetase